jgi:hypothetical protein
MVFYDTKFFDDLAENNGYTMILNESIKPLGHVGVCYIKPSHRLFVYDAQEGVP